MTRFWVVEMILIMENLMKRIPCSAYTLNSRNKNRCSDLCTHWFAQGCKQWIDPSRSQRENYQTIWRKFNRFFLQMYDINIATTARTAGQGYCPVAMTTVAMTTVTVISDIPRGRRWVFCYPARWGAGCPVGNDRISCMGWRTGSCNCAATSVTKVGNIRSNVDLFDHTRTPI